MKSFGQVRSVALLVASMAGYLLLSPADWSAADDSPAKYTPGPLLQRLLDGPMADVDEIVFATRVPGRDHWYVTFGNYAGHGEDPARLAYKKEDGVYWGYGDGGRLCRMNLRSGELQVLLDDPAGGVRDPQLHYDGRKILFSYRPGGTRVFHLYEIDIDGNDLVQLTDGPDDDIEPTYLPGGGIIFGSSRCRRFVNCWHTRVAALYRCDGDGGNIRMLSSNNDHDNTPWTLPDGRILYMRWEYVDRSQVHFHHLWTCNPDGTGQMVYYGNELGGIAMLDAKPIPGTKKTVVSFSPGHGRPEHLGYVTVVDPSRGPDVQQSALRISKDSNWKDPYAISEDCFLVAHRRGLFVMDGQGETELIYELPESDQHMQCHEPRPLRARPREAVIPSRVDLSKPTGELVLQDVYHGRNMAGVQAGEIKKLLVLQQVPKPVNFSGGMQPLTIGGSFTLAKIVGEVPVEPDGSAYMEVPALRSLFFVALDENDLAVKRMQSFVIVQPGEKLSCVGCHEQRNQVPHFAPTLTALEQPPHLVRPISDVPQVLDFPRDIQPILDRRCVECHNPDRREGLVDLTGDRTAMYSVSYWTMQTRGLVADGRNRVYSNTAPRKIGSSASRLMTLIDGSHYDAKLTPHEAKLVRLWIETGATYPGTYASLGCGHYPVDLARNQVAGRLSTRCFGCHATTINDQKGKRRVPHFRGGWGGRYEPLCNLSRPEKSYLLLAPLAREAGGLALCKEAVFKSTEDPLYRDLLAALRDAQARLNDGKRFDMPGFRPNEHYVREMQRFGFLPKSLKPDDPVDAYAVDRAYWESFDYAAAKQ